MFCPRHKIYCDFLMSNMPHRDNTTPTRASLGSIHGHEPPNPMSCSSANLNLYMGKLGLEAGGADAQAVESGRDWGAGRGGGG